MARNNDGSDYESARASSEEEQDIIQRHAFQPVEPRLPMSAEIDVVDLVHCRVQISGLTARVELNGQIGFVDAFVGSSGRYQVRVNSAAVGCLVLGLLPANLSKREWYIGMQGPDEVYAHLLSAYKIRIDDAYAAAGVIRGPLKYQSVDRSYEFLDWCTPQTDLRLFIARGADRGALPQWWSMAHTNHLMGARSVLMNSLHSGQSPAPEEPYDFIHGAANRADGISMVAELRAIGDAIEGPPPWGLADRGARDEIENRPTLRRSDPGKDSATICHRCRGTAFHFTTLGCGPGEIDCPYCGYQGTCPRCGRGAAVESGKCVCCGFAPRLYLRVHTHGQSIPGEDNDSYAKRGCALASRLPLPELQLIAVKNSAVVRSVNGESNLHGDMLPANVGDRLGESRFPELLTLLEAAHIFQAGLAILTAAIGIGVARSGVGSIDALVGNQGDAFTRACSCATAFVAADLKRISALKAGVTMIVDAFFESTKCIPTDTDEAQMLVLLLASHVIKQIGDGTGPNGGQLFYDHFAGSANRFSYTVGHLVADVMARRPPSTNPIMPVGDLKDVLDKMLSRTSVDWRKAGRTGCALDRLRARRMHARLLHLRSHLKLTRNGDTTGAYTDLDAAIALSPFTMGSESSSSAPIAIGAIERLRGLRAPMHLSVGRLDEARADLEAVVAHSHADAPDLHTDLYALAAIHLRQGRAAEGRICYNRACDAERRHKYLYGEYAASQDSALQPAAPVPVLEYFVQIAHTAYSQPGMEPLGVIVMARSVEGLPQQEVTAFADALDALTGMFGPSIDAPRVMQHFFQEHNSRVRTSGLAAAVTAAERSRNQGNVLIRSGQAATALAHYEEAMEALWPFESKLEAVWPLILCLSNHAYAANQLGRYEAAVDSCDDAFMLLARYGAALPRSDRSAQAAKLESRRSTAMQAMAAADLTEDQRAAEAVAAQEAAAEAAAQQAAEAEATADAQQARAEAEAEQARMQLQQHEAQEAQELAVRAAAEHAAAEQEATEQVARAVAEQHAHERRAARRAAEEQQALERRTAEAQMPTERQAAARTLAAARTREAAEAAERAAELVEYMRAREQIQAARRARRQTRALAQQQAEAAAQEREARERTEALERAARADRENAARSARQQRELDEAEEAGLVERISLREERERLQRVTQEAQNLERALAASLATASAPPPAALHESAPAMASAGLAGADDERVCNICLEGVEDGNEHALVQPCSTCNIFTHLGCAATWRIRCRNGQAFGRPSAPTCPGCRAAF